MFAKDIPKSPPLFDLYIEFVMRIFMTYANNESLKVFKFKYQIPTAREEGATIKRGPTIGTSELEWTGYADDIVIYLVSHMPPFNRISL